MHELDPLVGRCLRSTKLKDAGNTQLARDTQAAGALALPRKAGAQWVDRLPCVLALPEEAGAQQAELPASQLAGCAVAAAGAAAAVVTGTPLSESEGVLASIRKSPHSLAAAGWGGRAFLARSWRA